MVCLIPPWNTDSEKYTHANQFFTSSSLFGAYACSHSQLKHTKTYAQIVHLGRLHLACIPMQNSAYTLEMLTHTHAHARERARAHTQSSPLTLIFFALWSTSLCTLFIDTKKTTSTIAYICLAMLRTSTSPTFDKQTHASTPYLASFSHREASVRSHAFASTPGMSQCNHRQTSRTSASSTWR